MSFVDWIKEKSGDDSMKYVLAGGLVLVIAIALWGTISGMFGEDREINVPDTVHFYDIETGEIYELTKDELKEHSMGGDIDAVPQIGMMPLTWSPKTNDYTGVLAVKCPNCDTWYRDPQSFEPPSNEYICPECGTNRRDWYDEHRE